MWRAASSGGDGEGPHETVVWRALGGGEIVVVPDVCWVVEGIYIVTAGRDGTLAISWLHSGDRGGGGGGYV